MRRWNHRVCVGRGVTILGGATLFSSLVGAGIAALVALLIRRMVPSPQQRADADALLKLRAEIDYLGSPKRVADDRRREAMRKRMGPSPEEAGGA
jgi:hypothetical protein